MNEEAVACIKTAGKRRRRRRSRLRRFPVAGRRQSVSRHCRLVAAHTHTRARARAPNNENANDNNHLYKYVHRRRRRRHSRRDERKK